MKTCVVTATYGCAPNKVWLYMTNPTLNSWNPTVASAAVDLDGMHLVEKNKDGFIQAVVGTRDSSFKYEVLETILENIDLTPGQKELIEGALLWRHEVLPSPKKQRI